MPGLAKSWGPYAWYLFHILSLTWEKRNEQNYIYFFKLISKTIPCEICYINFNEKIKLKNYKIENNCSEKVRFIEWLVNLHNMVNKKNKKKYINYKK